MNRIQSLFKTKKENILSIYFTAGFPKLDDTTIIIEELEKSGADLIEIGIPFSDPLADGKTIQDSGSIALSNGMSITKLFEQLQNIRQNITIPLILMGYINPIYQYGIEKFCVKCKEIGIDGLIIPDLPLNEYKEHYQNIFEANNLSNIFLVTPQTPDIRIREIDAISNGFIYIVSSAAITGSQSSIVDAQITYFKRIENLKLTNPKLIGFGISNHETYKTACEHAEGVIIGSAFIQAIENSTDLKQSISHFIQEVRG